MPTIAWEEATRATLFVRSDLPTPANRCRHTMVSRLEGLVASDVIEEFWVTSWAKRVPFETGSSLGHIERDLYHRFGAWARSAGVRLEPGFDTRECYSSTTGTKQTQLVMPAACLVLYDDEDLLGVVPHATETGSVSIRDATERLADESAARDAPVSVTTA